MIAKHRPMIALVLAVLALAALGACSPSAEDEAAQADAEREAQIAQLEERRQEVLADRQELAAMRERLAAAEAGELPEGEEVDAEQLAQEIEAKEQEINAASDLLLTDVVAFVNEAPPVAGEPVSEINRRALDIKAGEEILLAQEYIDRGGDYGRAIGIYEEILKLDPENQAAQAAKADAEQMRYITPERFAQVTKGMTRDQVREVLGPPYYRNIKEYPEQGIILWPYAKAPGGAASGIYFRKKGDRYEAYRLEETLSGGGDGAET